MKRRGGVLGYLANGLTALFSGWLGAYSSSDPKSTWLEGWKPQRATANQALAPNLTTLVAQARHLERTSAMARGIVEGLRAALVGTGIDVEPQTGDDDLDDLAHQEWTEWAEHAGVAGESLWELQAQGAGEIATGGCALWRLVMLPERAAEGRLPLAILPLDIEWLSEIPVSPQATGTVFVRGIEVDNLGRPVAYHLRNPDIPGYGGGERVVADQIIHCFERRRAMQIHGEPLLAPSIITLQQAERLVAAELKAANNSAAMSVAITSDAHSDATDDDGNAVTDIPVGATVRLLPGEDVTPLAMTRPSQLIAPFFGLLRGLIAAASRVSQQWLDRDPSRASYSSARMDMMMDLRLHQPLQQAMSRHLASAPYERAMPWIMLKLGRRWPTDLAARRALLRHDPRPDRPGYVDPLKDGQAAIQNVNGLLTSLSEEITARGRNPRRVFEQQAKDRKLLQRYGLRMVTPTAAKDQPPAAQADQPPAPVADQEAA